MHWHVHPRLPSSLFWSTRKRVSYRRPLVSDGQLKRFSNSKLPHCDTLTAIHRANLILPKVLPRAKSSAWVKLLRISGDILSGAVARRRRIAVLGLDELCRPNELVSALLDDPLVSDHRTIDALRNRRTLSSNDSPRIISHHELQHSDAQLCLHLPWLKNLDVDIMEIPLGHPDAVPLLYDADIPILVTSPLTSPLSLEFQTLLSKPGSFLVIDYPIHDQLIMKYTMSRLTQHFSTISEIKMLQVYPSRALSALDVFRKGSNSVDAVQTFQNDFIGSGLTSLSQSITRALSSDRECQKAQHAQFILSGALDACRVAAQLNLRDIAAVQRFIDDLRSQISDAQTTSIQEILGGNNAPEVGDSIARSRREMQMVMDAIPWWKLPFRVDDLGGVLIHAAERVWCRDLHAKLEFQTGRLASLRSGFISNTLNSLRLLPASFHSAVLVNQLHQLSTRPPELAPNALTHPLLHRLQQLREPIHSLHRRAQRVILILSITTLSSIGAAYTSWFMAWITPATAVELSVFGFVAGLRWFTGRWEKGKVRWWEDWDRVGNGLQRDMKELVVQVVQDKVTSIPNKAAEELQNMVVLRLQENVKLDKELESIEGTPRHRSSEQNIPIK